MFSTRYSRTLVALSALMLLHLPGCGGARKTYPVEGKVAYPDGTPVPGGVVEFMEETAEGTGLNARGDIQPDGTYRLTTFQDGDGAVAGPHKVIVVWSRPEVVDPSKPYPKPYIHERYRSYETSGLTFTVQPDKKNVFPITVERP